MVLKWLASLLTVITALKYPNEVLDTPIVLCEPDRVIIKVRVKTNRYSNIYRSEQRLPIPLTSTRRISPKIRIVLRET